MRGVRLTYELELQFALRPDHELSRRAREAAARCPRCSCGHHPNAHSKTGCAVVVEKPGNKTSKCPCKELSAAPKTPKKLPVSLFDVKPMEQEDS